MPPKKKSALSSSNSGLFTDPQPSTSGAVAPLAPRTSSSRANVNKSVPRAILFMNLLRGRETGKVRSKQFIKEAWQMKVEDYIIRDTRQFGSKDLDFTIYFLRPGGDAQIAAFFIQSKQVRSVLAQLKYDMNTITRTTPLIPSKFTVVDACQASVNPNALVFITNNRSNQGILNIVTPAEPGEVNNFQHVHPSSKPFNCCNANFFTKRLAVGLEREVCVYDSRGLNEVRLLRHNIYGLTYNRKGTLLYMGTEKGKFVLYDLRAMEVVARMKLDQNVLDDVQILSDEAICLVSGYSGKLMKIDLRNRKKVFDLPSHVRRSQKIPVSFNEQFELISCTGADDKTRIWNLKSGDLLHTFSAPSTYPARSCFVPNSPRGQIHLVQDNFVYLHSMLTGYEYANERYK